MALLIAILTFVFIIGLCIGSFLNVVILRALSEESIVFPASKCPKCQNPLKWWHNIPVLSYILLGGKCAFCKENQYSISNYRTYHRHNLCINIFKIRFYCRNTIYVGNCIRYDCYGRNGYQRKSCF